MYITIDCLLLCINCSLYYTVCFALSNTS
jgi:hypothetical protein